MTATANADSTKLRQATQLASFIGPEDQKRDRWRRRMHATNVSLWTSLQAAKQLDTFQPMLDLGKPFAAKGATFERPIMNYATLWQLKGSGPDL